MADQGCGNCPHAFDPHILFALHFDALCGNDMPVAGIVLCPECDCVLTWASDGYPVPGMPSEKELAVLREGIAG